MKTNIPEQTEGLDSRPADLSSQTTTVLASATLTLAILQTPLFYYYIGGLFAVMVGVIYLPLGLLLTIVLIVLVLRAPASRRTRCQVAACFLAPVFGLSTFFSENLIETAEWQLRRPARNAIVEHVKHSEIFPPGTHATMHVNNFPPISTCGNDVIIEYGKSRTVTMTFFINCGFLDHYSALVYSDDSDQMKELERMTIHQSGNEKLDNNWYRVSY